MSKEELRAQIEYDGPEALVWNDDDTDVADLFLEELLKTNIGQLLQAQSLITSTNVGLIVDQARNDFDVEDPNFKQFCASAKALFLSGDLEPDVEPVDTRPRGRDGKVLSQSQIRWGELTLWANDHTSEECRKRAQGDQEFQAFMQTRLRQEMGEAPVSLHKVVGAKKPLSKEAIPTEVYQFAEDWKRMTTQQARQALSPAAMGEIAAAHYQRLFDNACELGLL